MDDHTAQPTRATYRCPGHARPIDRATHLGRLAVFYPACRTCEHRDDYRQLTDVQISRWDEIVTRAPVGVQFSSEGLEAGSINALGPSAARRFAAALGVVLWNARAQSLEPPAVLVGADGHWTTAELLSAACSALELTGCRTIETGAVTTAALAAAAHRLGSDAALWIGNASGVPHTIALRAWGAHGRPWSAPGGVDTLRSAYEANTPRPKRRGGRLERAAIEAPYCEPLAPQFHALRPLRVVIDTVCLPLVRCLERLTRDAACQIVPLASLPPHSGPATTDPMAFEAATATSIARRLAALGRAVATQQAHFGLWIDGAGESCRLVDERGHSIAPDRLCRLLAGYVRREQPDAQVVIAPEGATRESMCAAMEAASGAALGATREGLYWFGGAPPLPDALLVTSLLLTLFSESDRPVSEVLDGA